MKTIAIYPGTFDPITLGHKDLIERAARMFGQVIVGVAANINKKPLLTLAERIKFAKEALIDIPNVTVLGFECLLIEFMQQHNAKIILRGLRVVSDFDYEFQLAAMNRHLAPEIETMFLMPAEQYAYISSSFVRETAMLGGNVEQFVPQPVAKVLQQKMRERYGA